MRIIGVRTITFDRSPLHVEHLCIPSYDADGTRRTYNRAYKQAHLETIRANNTAWARANRERVRKMAREAYARRKLGKSTAG